jgi:hypothetical protein
VNWG